MIFAAETCVVSLATLRTIFMTRGMKYVAAGLGFFEVSLWLMAISEVMRNLADVRCSLAFAGGFTLGNFLGILIEQKLALGRAVVKAITARDVGPLVERLRAEGYGVTCVEGQGALGPVRIVFTVVPRKEIESVLGLLRELDPEVFYSIQGVQSAAAGVEPARRRRWPLVPLGLRLPVLPWLGRG
jgi:uncharacterized protein YebE (UPF0316 family)